MIAKVIGKVDGKEVVFEHAEGTCGISQSLLI